MGRAQRRTPSATVAFAGRRARDGAASAYHFLPIARGEPLLQPDNPLASVDVGLVLPHRTDAFAEHVVIANGWPVLNGAAQMDVELPEVLRLTMARGGRREARCVWLLWRERKRGALRKRTATWRRRTVWTVPSAKVLSS